MGHDIDSLTVAMAAEPLIFIVSIQEPFSSPWTMMLREPALPRRLP